MADWDLLNELYRRMCNIIQCNTSLNHAIRSVTQQRLSEYHRYATGLELARQNFDMQITAASNEISELETSLMQLQTHTDKLQAREMELQDKVQILQQQNREYAFKLDEAQIRVLDHTTLWYEAFERAEKHQKTLDLATPPSNSKLQLHSINPSRSRQTTPVTNKRGLSIHQEVKELSVVTKTS